jgi:sulfate adenylyltransferase subunit 2
VVAELTAELGGLDLFERLTAIRSCIRGRIVFTTSFGLEDQAIAHVLFSQKLKLDVATLDTGRLFPETYEVWAATERRYGTRIAAFTPDRADVEALIARQGIDGMRSSVAARLECCAIRKVEPLARLLDGATAWITGLRADQSTERARTLVASFEEERRLIKINPLFDWTRERTIDFVRAYDVPYNTLCMIAASCRSDVRLAPGRSRRASPNAPGAGGGSRKRKKSAACISPLTGASPAPLSHPLETDRRANMDALPPAFDRADDAIAPTDAEARTTLSLTHLEQLEAESIHIIREAVAESENPAMLYSIGKDSSVLLHLAMKAFFPAKPPLPLLHIDTTWKFREMIAFRDARARELGLDLIVHVNQEGLVRGINPVTSGSELHTDVMKTQALRQALDHHRFDVAFGGARRDEEKSRAKERVFSFRNVNHVWNPKRQRAEPWRIYNGRKRRGESIRVFPLSNWTELDVWFYIHQERIPVVPLYFAAPRPIVERDGTLIMVDDERLPLAPGERPQIKTVRFRTLGCYPLTGGIESNARTVPEIIRETLESPYSERRGRVIDRDGAASMERKKQEGYF